MFQNSYEINPVSTQNYSRTALKIVPKQCCCLARHKRTVKAEWIQVSGSLTSNRLQWIHLIFFFFQHKVNLTEKETFRPHSPPSPSKIKRKSLPFGNSEKQFFFKITNEKLKNSMQWHDLLLFDFSKQIGLSHSIGDSKPEVTIQYSTTLLPLFHWKYTKHLFSPS